MARILWGQSIPLSPDVDGHLLDCLSTRFSALGGSGTAGSPEILQASISIFGLFFHEAGSQKAGSPCMAI